MRWLTGSLNGATWAQVRAAASLALVVLGARCCSARPATSTVMQLGDDAAAALGVRVERTRILVDRRRGRPDRLRHRRRRADRVRRLPVRADRRPDRRPRRLAAGARRRWSARCWCWSPTSSASTPSAPATRSASITGVLGAPYLVYLIIRTNRAGGSL